MVDPSQTLQLIPEYNQAGGVVWACDSQMLACIQNTWGRLNVMCMCVSVSEDVHLLGARPPPLELELQML